MLVRDRALSWTSPATGFLGGEADLPLASSVFYATKNIFEAECHGCFLLWGVGKQHDYIVHKRPGAGEEIQQVVDVNVPEQCPQYAASVL